MKFCVCEPFSGIDFNDSITDIKTFNGVYVPELKVWVIPDFSQIDMDVKRVIAVFLGEFESEFSIRQNLNLHNDIKSCI